MAPPQGAWASKTGALIGTRSPPENMQFPPGVPERLQEHSWTDVVLGSFWGAFGPQLLSGRLRGGPGQPPGRPRRRPEVPRARVKALRPCRSLSHPRAHSGEGPPLELWPSPRYTQVVARDVRAAAATLALHNAEATLAYALAPALAVARATLFRPARASVPASRTCFAAPACARGRSPARETTPTALSRPTRARSERPPRRTTARPIKWG